MGSKGPMNLSIGAGGLGRIVWGLIRWAVVGVFPVMSNHPHPCSPVSGFGQLGIFPHMYEAFLCRIGSWVLATMRVSCSRSLLKEPDGKSIE